MKYNFKAVIFDMDGVLTETSEEHFLAWKALAKELGFVLPDPIKDEVKGISRMASLEIVLSAGHMADAFTIEEKEGLATRKNDIYLDLIQDFSPKNLSQGAQALLKSLKENGILIGLASASKNAPFLLKAMAIEHYFDTVVDPRGIKNGKPAPDIFLKAAEQLGLEPSKCIAVEDAFAGIESILSAGMIPIGIGSGQLLWNAKHVFNDLKPLSYETITQIWNL